MKKRFGLLCASLFFVLALAMIFLPRFITEANAAAPSSITVNGKTLTSGQYLVGSSVTATKPSSGGYFYYYNGTLTVYNISGMNCNKGMKAVEAVGDLTINVSGTSTITGNGAYVINVTGGKLKFTGSGNLTLNNSSYDVICAGSDLEFAHTGNITINGIGSASVYCNGAMTVGGNLTISADNCMGLFSVKSITVNSGTVNITGGSYASYAAIKSRDGGFTVNGGTVTVNGEGNGIVTKNGFFQRGGKVTITAEKDGILVEDPSSNAVVYAGDLYVNAVMDGVQANEFYINGGQATIMSTNTAYDSSYCAVKVTNGLVKKSHITAKGSTLSSGIEAENITAANLGTYDNVQCWATIQINGYSVSDGMYFQFASASVSNSKPSSGGYAFYQNNTLTLHNYTGSSSSNGITHNYDLTLILSGSSHVTAKASDSAIEGIYVNGDLTIQGSGDLTLYNGGYAVYATGNLTVNSSTLDCRNSGLYAGGNMTLTNANITFGQMGTQTAKKNVINALGSLTIKGSNTYIYVNSTDTVYSNGSYVAARALYGNSIEILAGTINLYCSEGIMSASNLTIKGGYVYVSSAGTGVTAKNITVSAGTLNATGNTDGINATKLTVNDGSVIAASQNTANDSSYCAINVSSPYSTNFVVADKLAVIGNGGSTSTNSSAVNVSNLSTYDYIRIGDFIMLHEVVVPSGYYMESGNSVTSISTTAPSSGKYAYYYNGTLTLDDYTYTGSSVAIRTYADTKISLVGGSEVNHIISHSGDLTFQGSGVLEIDTNLSTDAINSNGDVSINNGRITINSDDGGIYCNDFSLKNAFVWLTANYNGIDFNSNFTVSSGAITIKSTNTSGDASYRAINSRGSNPTISITGMNHMVGKTSSPDILASTNFTGSDYDFAAIGEFIMVRGVILYKGCYLFNGDAQPYQNVGSHTEYAYLKDKNTLELKGYQYSGSAYGIASNIDLTIVLYDEENSIEAKGNYKAIYCNANLTIKGGTNYNDGIIVKSANSYGVYAQNKCTIDSANVTVTSSDYPVSVGEFIMNQGGRLKSTCTYSGSTYTCAALAANSATINGGRIDLFAATNKGDALEVKNNLVIKGGTVILNSPNGDGITISDGTMTVQGGDIDISAGENGIYLYNGSYLSVQGGEIDITATQNGIWLYSGRLNMNGGFLTVASTATSDDSSYRAIRLNGTSSDYYNVASTLIQTASVNSTGTGIVDLAPANLSTYDFVVIGDYIWVGDQKLPSGYSISPDGTMVEGNKGAGYAYYSNGTLTLNGFHYTSSLKRGILSHTNLTISVIGNSSISTEGQYCIYVYGNLTFVGSRTLTLSSERVAAIRSYGNVSVAGTDLVINAPLDTGMFAEEGSVTLSSGSLKITSFDEGISAKSMTVSGGELHVVSTYGNGIYLSDGKFTMTGGFATIICSCENIDSSISAIKLEAGSDSYNVSANLTQAASIFYTWKNSVKLVPANLNDYDYVVIGDFVDIGGVIVQSGYSVNADGTVFEGYKGTGYAYYYNGTLALDGFTYTGENIAIYAHNDLILQLKNTNELRVTGDYYGIEAYGDLTITGNGSLSIVAENVGVTMNTENCQLVINSGQLTITSGNSGMICNDVEVIINGGTLIITAGYDGIVAGSNNGIVTINGGTIDVTASRYAILMKSFIINDGKLSAKSTNRSGFNAPDIQWNEDMQVLVSDSLDESQLAPLEPNKLPTGKKYVKIENNNYVEIDGNRVFSGYSIDKNGNIIKGNGGSGYAYYYKGTLTLDGFTLTCENVAIYAHRDLILELKNTNELRVTGNDLSDYGIVADGNLTVSGTGSLNLVSKRRAVYLTTKDSEFVMNGGQLTIDTDGNGIDTNGANVIINGGTLNIDSGSYGISTGSDYNSETVTQNGGELSIYCSGYGIYTSKIRINGGQMSVKSTGIMVFNTTDVKWVDQIVFLVSDSLNENQLVPLAPNKLPTGKKYVKTDSPRFTVQPNGDEVETGEKLTVTWATNFTPVRLEVLEYSGEQPTNLVATLSGSATNTSLEASKNGYCIRAYYSNTGYVDSDKFYVTEKGNTVSGTITSFGSTTDTITVELWKDGAASAAYSTTTKGNTAMYSIEGVEPGTYTLKIMKPYHLPVNATIIVTEDTVVDIDLVLGNNGKQFKFNSAYLNLTQDINFVYVATIPEGFTNPYVVFTMNGRNYTVTESTLDNLGRNCFKFLGVNPHWMGDNVSATVYATVGGIEVSFTQANYSIKQYCKNQLSKTTDNELKALLSDLLVYGEKAQLYQGYKTNELVTAGLTLYPSTFQALGAEYNKQTITGTKNTSIDFGGAGLYLSNNAAIRYTIATSEPAKYTYEITIKGKTRTFTGEDLKYVDDGKYYLFFDGIMATEFDEVVTARIFENGIQVGRTVEYSVNTYIQKYQNDQSTLGPMLRALYNYGNSATAYAD